MAYFPSTRPSAAALRALNAGALAAIERFLSIAMRNPDSAPVSTSNLKENGGRP